MIITLIIFLLTILAFFLYLSVLRKFKPENCKKVWQYFIPTLASSLIVLFVIFFTVPFGLDALDLAAGTTEIRYVYVDSVSRTGKVETQEGESFRFSVFEDEPVEGNQYQMNISNRTNFAYNFVLLEENVRN